MKSKPFKPFDSWVLGTLMDEKSLNPLGKADFLKNGKDGFYFSTHNLYIFNNRDIVNFLKVLPDDKQNKYIEDLDLEDFNYGGIDEMFKNLDSVSEFNYCAFLLKSHSNLLEDYEKKMGWNNLDEAKKFLKDTKFELDNYSSSSQTVLFNKDALKAFFKIAAKKFPSIYAYYKYHKNPAEMTGFYGSSVSASFLEIKDEQGNVLKVPPLTSQVMEDMPNLNIPLFRGGTGTEKNPSYVIEDALEIDVDVIMGLGKEKGSSNQSNDRFNVYRKALGPGKFLMNGDLSQELVQNKLIVKSLGPKFYISSGKLLRNDEIKELVLAEFSKIYKRKFSVRNGFCKPKEMLKKEAEALSADSRWGNFLTGTKKMKEQLSFILHKATWGDVESWSDKKKEVYRKDFYNVMQDYLDEQMDSKAYENLKNNGILKNYLHLLSRNLLDGQEKYDEIEGVKKDFKEIRFYTLKDLTMDLETGAGSKLLSKIIYNKDFPEIHTKAYDVIFKDFIFNHMNKFDFKEMNGGILKKAMHTIFVEKGSNMVFEDYKFALFDEGLKRGFFDDPESALTVAAKNMMLKTYSSNDLVLLYDDNESGNGNNLKHKIKNIFSPPVLEPETKIEKNIKIMNIHMGDFKPINRYGDLENFLKEREANIKTIFTYIKIFNQGVMAATDELLKRENIPFNYLEMNSVFKKSFSDKLKERHKNIDCLYEFKTPLFFNLGDISQEQAQEFKENITTLAEQVWDSVLTLDKDGLKRGMKDVVPTYRAWANAFLLNKDLNKNMEKVSGIANDVDCSENDTSNDDYTFKI